MGMYEDLQEQKQLYEEGLITENEYINIKNIILDSKKGITPSDDNKVVRSGNNHIAILSVGIVSFFLVIIFIITFSVNASKQKYADQLSDNSNYDVKYEIIRDKYVLDANNVWKNKLELNVDSYVEDETVYNYFINEWRTDVIPWLEDESTDSRGAGSTFVILNPENSDRDLLEIKNGEVVYDEFEDIEE